MVERKKEKKSLYLLPRTVGFLMHFFPILFFLPAAKSTGHEQNGKVLITLWGSMCVIFMKNNTLDFTFRHRYLLLNMVFGYFCYGRRRQRARFSGTCITSHPILGLNITQLILSPGVFVGCSAGKLSKPKSILSECRVDLSCPILLDNAQSPKTG